MLTVAVGSFAALLIAQAAEPPSAAVDPISVEERRNVELNLRWMLERERKGGAEKAKVGVFADAGVWHPGAKAIVDALESAGTPCRAFDRTLLKEKELSQFDAVVFPGGWAPFQWTAAGDSGLAAVKKYVERGGRVVGVCAGAYLMSKDVRYDGKNYPYPLGLFDGAAEGPVAGLADYPKPGGAKLKVTDKGTKRGLRELFGKDVYYSGGPKFVGGSGIEVLANYHDGSAAVIARKVGKGELILIGVHPELPPGDSFDAASVRKLAGDTYKALCFGKRSQPLE